MTINGYRVPKDLGNQHFYGIEIESLGTESGVHDPLNDPTPNGMTEEQVLATAELTAALCELVDGDETAVIRHKDWAPNRKVDVKQTLEFWRARVALQLKANRMEDAYQVLARAEKDPSVKTQETRDLAVKLSKLGYYTGPVKPVGEQGFPRVAFSKWKASSMVPTVIGYTREAHARLWQA
jgi:N-acetyl-anhydromuramyl-L-alanine amidase AmpD